MSTWTERAASAVVNHLGVALYLVHQHPTLHGPALKGCEGCLIRIERARRVALYLVRRSSRRSP